MPSNRCCICLLNDQAEFIPYNSRYSVKCDRCGTYEVTERNHGFFSDEIKETNAGHPRLGKKGLRTRANASAWVRREHPKEIAERHLEILTSVRTPYVWERAERLLLAMNKKTDMAGQFLDLGKSEWLAHSWAVNLDELRGLTEIATQHRWILQQDSSAYDWYFRIDLGGWEHLRKKQISRKDSDQGFVAMWFAKSMDSAFDDAIELAIKTAGYQPFRVDRKPHVNKIDDEIISEIRKSRFVVADLTGERPSVYFEAGFAHGIGIPVFYTAKNKTKRHFDLRQYNCIIWNNEHDLRNELQERIEAVIGKGPLLDGDGDEK